jgi:ABC-type nitrate/sulfonate/bicarbonate transport system substrate-binding protein
MEYEYEWPQDRNLVTREQLRDSLAQYSREPFGDVLEALLQARPSTERLMQWAKEDPAQWANAIKIFSLLNGYTEKTESISIHKHLHLHKLSDAELIQETQKMIASDPSLVKDLRAIDARQRALEQIQENPFEEVGNKE